MAEPAKKTPAIEALIDSLNPSGRKRIESIRADTCSWCGHPAEEFKDDLSRREYALSGYCQSCQDKTFVY